MSVKMKSMYAKSLYNFIENVNKLDNVKLSWANAYNGRTNDIMYVDDSSKFNKITSNGGDKLLLTFTSKAGRGTRTVYGFRNDPNLGKEGSNVTSLAYTSKASGGRDSKGIFAAYNKTVASRDEMLQINDMSDDVIDSLSRHTSRIFNSVYTYGVLFDGHKYHNDYDDQILEVKDIINNEGITEDILNIRDDIAATIEDGMFYVEDGVEPLPEDYLTCDNDSRFACMDMLAATYEDIDDVPIEYVDRTLGLDKLYNVLSEINNELEYSDKPIDLSVKLLESDNKNHEQLCADSASSVLGLNMVALYGTIRRKNNLLSKSEDKDKVQEYPQVVVSDNLHEALVYVNADRKNRFNIRMDNFDKISDKIGTPIHVYDKYLSVDGKNMQVNDIGRSLNIASKYRIYQSIINPESKNKALDIPYAKLSYNEDAKEYLISYNDKNYTLQDFVNGTGECSTLRDKLPCLASYPYDELTKNVNGVYKKFAENNPDRIDCDILVAEMQAFKSKLSKDSDITRIIQNEIQNFDDRYADYISQQGTVTFSVIHNTNVPSFENGTYEIGNFVQDALNKTSMNSLNAKSDDKIIETCVDDTKNDKGIAAKAAYSFRETDLAFKKLDLIKQQYGYDNYEDIIKNNCKGFGMPCAYKSAINKYISEQSYIGESKANDFLVLVDAYKPTLTKSINTIVEDIDRVYRDLPNISPSNAIYRPKNINEVNILRNLCSDCDILNMSPGAISGRTQDGENKSFEDVIISIAKAVKTNDPEYDISKAIDASTKASRLYDTVSYSPYAKIVDNLIQINNKYDGSNSLYKSQDLEQNMDTPIINFSL